MKNVKCTWVEKIYFTVEKCILQKMPSRKEDKKVVLHVFLTFWKKRDDDDGGVGA